MWTKITKQLPPFNKRVLVVKIGNENVVISKLVNDKEYGVTWSDDDSDGFYNINTVDLWIDIPEVVDIEKTIKEFQKHREQFISAIPKECYKRHDEALDYIITSVNNNTDLSYFNTNECKLFYKAPLVRQALKIAAGINND